MMRDQELGPYVAELIETQMQERVSPATFVLLQPCIKSLGKLIEGLCPIALDPTPEASAYGPARAPLSFYAFFVSREGGITVDTSGWPETPEALEAYERSDVWAGVVEAIKAENERAAMTLLAYRLGSQGVNGVEAVFADIRQQGLTPCVAALAGRANGQVGGYFTAFALPPAIEQQLDTQH
jgi:hypothetical protein